MREARDAYRHDVKGDEKRLAEFESEVANVARERGIYYRAETSFKKLNDYLKLGYHPKDLCEANVYMRFPDNCEALFSYSRKGKTFTPEDEYPRFTSCVGDYEIADIAAKFQGITMLGYTSTLPGELNKVAESIILNRADSPLYPWHRVPFGKTPEGIDYHLLYDEFVGWAQEFYTLCSDTDGVDSELVKACLLEQAKETYGKELALSDASDVPDYIRDLAKKDFSIVTDAIHIKEVQEKARQALEAVGLNISDRLVDDMVSKSMSGFC